MLPKIYSWLLLLAFINSIKSDDFEKATENDDWTGKWFPHMPTAEAPNLSTTLVPIKQASMTRVAMGVYDKDCDDAQTNLSVDFDPKSPSDRMIAVCLHNRTLFEPSYKTEATVQEKIIPFGYSALHRCMNESIEYDDLLPTFGTHRPLWPQYGEYTYVPPQRWLHNLEHGAVVMLYHPCANANQVSQLKKLVKSCLYRHVITPSQLLTPARPMALVTWGKSYELSTIWPNGIKDFIKTNALQGPEKTFRNGQYDHLLIDPAKNVSATEDDTELCPNVV